MTSRTRSLLSLLFVVSFAVLSFLWTFQVAAETVMVEMRDGVKLATDFYVPTEGGPKFPVVLARSVYGARGGSGPRRGCK